MVGFGILAFQANAENRQGEATIYACLALLFQPFLKISLGREVWNIVDVVVATGLVITAVGTPKSR